MKLEVWDEFAAVEQQIDDLMRSYFGPRAVGFHPVLPLFSRRPFVPATDVFARGDEVVIRLEVPGIDPSKDVTVTVEKGYLVIRGERKRKEDIERGSYYRMEAAYGSFVRSIPIPDGVDEDEIRARYADGVLEVIVPKPAQGERGTKTVPVNVEEPRRATKVA
jgi:HSP20 family protein